MMTFAWPTGFWLLSLIPLFFAVKIGGDRHALKRAAAYMAPGEKLPQSGGWSALICYALAWGLLTTALARPQAGEETIEATVESRQILFTLDVSKSMLAQDVTPNRLERSKLLVRDMMRKFPNDRIGLIVFAGTAFLQAPLTNDHIALEDVLDAVDHEIIPRGGTNISRALRLAIDTFNRENAADQALVLISDGGELEGQAIATAKEAQAAHIKILVVGAGTEDGAIIPDPDLPGEFIRHGVRDEIVRSRLQTDVLRQIADNTGGEYFQLGGDPNLAGQLAKPLEAINQTKENSKIFRRPLERFHWFLIPGLALLIAGWTIETLSSRSRP